VRHLEKITLKANREGRKRGRFDSTRIINCVVNSTMWEVNMRDTLKKSHKKANREGRKSGPIDSNRPLCSRFDYAESRFVRHLKKLTQEGEQGG